MEEYDSMSMAQRQQLHELWKKAQLVKGKKTPESERALEARVALLKQKQTILVMRDFSQMKNSEVITEIIQPFTERRNGTRKSHANN